MNESNSRQSMRDQILDIAENGYRAGGYAGLSFRNIADVLGIKSASVHYHFPQKEDLGRAVVERYTENFLGSLGAPDDSRTPKERLQQLVTGYQNAYRSSGSSCLCAVMGAVSGELPEPVRMAVKQFFVRLLMWAERALQGDHNIPSPQHIISALQGAMIMSVATGNAAHLDKVADELSKAP